MALPLFTARSVVNASSGRASLASALATADADDAGGRSPRLAMRMAATRAALMRGLSRVAFGMGARHVGHDVFACATHLVKQPRQKLCWHGAWGTRLSAPRGLPVACPAQPRRPPVARGAP